MSCGVGRRRGSDPMLLWLWCRLAATAPIRPLAWEPLYAAGVAQEMAKRQKKIFFLELFYFIFLWPHLQYMEVPSPGIQFELQLSIYPRSFNPLHQAGI